LEQYYIFLDIAQECEAGYTEQEQINPVEIGSGYQYYFIQKDMVLGPQK